MACHVHETVFVPWSVQAEKGDAMEQLEKAKAEAARKDIRIADLEWDYANAIGGSVRPPSRDEVHQPFTSKKIWTLLYAGRTSPAQPGQSWLELQQYG